MKMPVEVIDAISGALPADKTLGWWTGKHDGLGGRSPEEAWESGKAGQVAVMNIIEGAKSGDMS